MLCSLYNTIGVWALCNTLRHVLVRSLDSNCSEFGGLRQGSPFELIKKKITWSPVIICFVDWAMGCEITKKAKISVKKRLKNINNNNNNNNNNNAFIHTCSLHKEFTKYMSLLL